MDSVAKNHLLKLHITVPNDWIRECIQFVLEEAGQQARQPNWAQANIPKLVYEQWLEADLRDLQSSCLPPNLADIKTTVIKGYFALQVNSLLDISQPAFQQVMKIEGVDRSNAEVTAEPISQKKDKSNRMLKLEMTDGVQTIHGMEYEEIPFLNANLPPGTKVIIFGAVHSRRGILLLTKQNLKVLGGKVDDLAANNQVPLLRRILKLANNSDSAQESRQGMNGNVGDASKVLSLPTLVGQGVVPENPHILNDGDDLSWDDDIDMFEDDFELQNGLPTLRSNSPKPQLAAINAEHVDQVTFNGFDDEDDDPSQWT